MGTVRLPGIAAEGDVEGKEEGRRLFLCTLLYLGRKEYLKIYPIIM
jgi:hypothetical protein